MVCFFRHEWLYYDELDHPNKIDGKFKAYKKRKCTKCGIIQVPERITLCRDGYVCQNWKRIE